MKVACSILSIKENKKENIMRLGKTDCDYLHLDIMDGRFVPNQTLENEEMISLVKDIRKPIDIHIMVEDIGSYIETYRILYPQNITFHLEATQTPEKWISILKQYGIGVGISIKPETPVDLLLPYLAQIDLVLVMSVEPGYGGQSFIEEVVPKIKTLKKWREEKGYSYLIEVDGGIQSETIHQVVDADIVVSGSFVTNASDYQFQIDLLRKESK